MSSLVRRWAVSNTELMSLSVLNFEGRIKLIDSRVTDDDPQGIRDLLGLGGSSKVLGFDTESKPKALYSQSRNPTALIQLASDNVCVMWRTIGRKKLPDSLLSILEDPSVIKVGQGIGLDLRDMREDFSNIGTVSNVVDLHKVASSLNCQPKSLQGLVGMFLRKRLLKDMRVSNWESETLRVEQVQYAAIDAWAARAVFLEMQKRELNPEKIGSVVDNYEKQETVVLPTAVPASAIPENVDNRSPQVRLVDHCVKHGFFLRLSGFEKDSFGDKFKCVFEINRGGKDAVKIESARSHASIRAAQEDAASVALEFLARTPS